MSIMIWNEDYSVGVDSLDNDHIILFSLINYLNDARLEGQETKIVGKLLDTLVQYAVGHFQREETRMRKAGYGEDAFNLHKEEHAQFGKQILDLQQRFEKQGSEGLGEDLGEFLSGWLVDHILDTDMQYKPYVQENSD